MSIQFNQDPAKVYSGAQTQPLPKKDWWEELSDENPIDELDVEFVRQQIEQVLNRPSQVNVEQLLSSAWAPNPVDAEALKDQLISNCQQPK